MAVRIQKEVCIVATVRGGSVHGLAHLTNWLLPFRMTHCPMPRPSGSPFGVKSQPERAPWKLIALPARTSLSASTTSSTSWLGSLPTGMICFRPVHRHRALRLLHGERGDGDLVVAVGRVPALLVADFGADVVKIEPPGGDGFRNWPPQVDSGEGEPYGISFAVLNRRLAALLIRRQMPRGLRDD